jgi:hypothetical protein
MKKWLILTNRIVAVMLLAGCGKVEEVNEDVDEGYTPPPAANCRLDPENVNDYGCYGNDKTYGNLLVTEGVWSLYKKSKVDSSIDPFTYFDLITVVYRFFPNSADGAGGFGSRKDLWTNQDAILQWGVNADGTELRTSEGHSFVITGRFVNDNRCFNVKDGSDETELKLCNEDLINEGKTAIVAGYYGADVKLGNYTHGNIVVPGTWKLTDNDGSGDAETEVVFDANGTVGGTAVWGVSGDGKQLSILDGGRKRSYGVYRYLPNGGDCLVVLEFDNSLPTGQIWKMCKQQ